MKTRISIALAATFLSVVVAAQEATEPHAPATSRDALLSSLDTEREAEVAPLQAEATKSHAKATAIYKKVVRLEKVKRLSTRGARTLQRYRDEIKEADKTTASFKQKLALVNDSFEQQRLEILAENVFPGEAAPVKVQGRWMTAERYTEYVEERKAIERQGVLRINGQRLADWVMQTLGGQYEMKSEKRAPLLIRQAKVRSVRPSRKPVYSLRPDRTKVEMQAAQFHASTDDLYPFKVTWQTRGGKLLQKNGYVEIGYGNDGTAYLLGVNVPFLDNPLDGTMAATRSVLDEAIGRAFGR